MSHFKDFFSRREVLKAGLSTGIVSWGMSDLAFAEEKPLPLIKKKIPSTGEELTCVGIGTNSFTLADAPNIQAVLKRMHELGGTFIDSASAYKESEATIGTAMTNLGMRNQFFISSKISGG